MPWSSKLFIIVAIISITFGYAYYQRGEIHGIGVAGKGLILQKLPMFTIQDVETQNPLTPKELVGDGARGAFVHFWGTWCAPCEAELPSFLSFAKKFENSGVKFLLLAVNDELPKVKKFLRRFSKTMPSNVLLGIDVDGVTLDLFGTVKVPETYLFNASLKHLNKFIGPQDWEKPYYKDKAERYLLDTSLPPVFQKVETH
jgi:cytochrome c biogenesis protein CcmG/thiol:disulfide interchange protein DsbE